MMCKGIMREICYHSIAATNTASGVQLAAMAAGAVCCIAGSSLHDLRHGIAACIDCVWHCQRSACNCMAAQHEQQSAVVAARAAASGAPLHGS